MNIAGVVVNALPEKNRMVEKQLVQLPGVEVHAVNELGRMVVTIEGNDERVVADLVSQMHTLEGVLSAAMIYHSFDQSMNEEASL